MLDIHFVREHTQEVKDSIAKRGLKVDLDALLEADKERTRLSAQIDELRAKRNKPSAKPTPEEIANLQQVKEKLSGLEEEYEKVDGKFSELMRSLPNLLSSESPEGGEEKNKVLRSHGEKPSLSFEPKDHVTLGEELDLIDFERASKVTGARFYYYKNEMVRLNLALTQYALDILIKEGFTPIETPDLARNEILDGIGFAPRGPESQIYNIEGEEISLIGTSEITLGGYHADEILEAEKLPLKYVGISHCFRKEAGAYGQYSRGTYRVHQFTKVEMFIYCLPEESEKMHEYLLSLEEKIYQGLKIPYQVVEIAAGDLGAAAFRKFDIEAWMPGRDGYGEITSTSNTTDFQSRRLGIRFRGKDGKTRYAHTLNGTAVALSRAPIAIVENFQQQDGSIIIPEVLRPFMGGIDKIEIKR
jgi:seryl-tRNA synthetase